MKKNPLAQRFANCDELAIRRLAKFCKVCTSVTISKLMVNTIVYEVVVHYYNFFKNSWQKVGNDTTRRVVGT